MTDDLVTGLRTIRLHGDDGTTRIDDRGIVTRSSGTDVFTIHPDDPLTARLVSEYRWAVKSGPADIDTYARTELTADATHFHLTWRLEARDGGHLVHAAGRSVAIPRDFC